METEHQTPADQTLDLQHLLDLLLKDPEKLLSALRRRPAEATLYSLIGTTVAAVALYGLVVGTFSGGIQLWAAPLKLGIGLLVSAVMCFPSLYIFSCLSGADLSLRDASILMVCSIALAALLLVGVAPVAWIFSQSTESETFMGGFHLLCWGIALGGFVSVVRRGLKLYAAQHDRFIKVWILMFCLVTLQMTTTLRPIVGTASSILPERKRFFITHWLESMESEEQRIAKRKIY